MIIVNLKPFAQYLAERLQKILAGHSSVTRAVDQVLHPPCVEQESQDMDVDSETVFLASIVHLPEAERTERIQRRQWYAAMAGHQAIADVEWRQQRYQQAGNPLYRP